MPAQSFHKTVSSSPLDEIREQAAQWVVHLEEADSRSRNSLEKECEKWQSTSAEHRKIFLEIQKMWNAVDSSKSSGVRQKQMMGVMMLFVSVLTLSLLPWNYWSADYQTKVGEVAEVTLPDNSKAYLNTNSAINVNYAKDTRDIVLEEGELFVVVNKDKTSRPFRVVTVNGNATALGTQYITKLDKNTTSVAVVESTVLIEPKNSNLQDIKLSAGQKIELSKAHITAPSNIKIKTPDWIHNRITFNNESIVNVIDKLSKYHSGYLYISKEALDDDLRFTGVLPTDDISLAMSTLAASLNLEAKQVTPYVIWMEKRK